MSWTAPLRAPRQWWRQQTVRRRWQLAVVAWLASGLYVVGPDQVAVVRTCGRPSPDAVPAGVWWRAPWPLGRVTRLRLAQPRQVSIGVSTALSLVGQDTTPTAEHLTGDQNLVRIRATAQYTVTDPHRYLFAADRVDALVAACVQSSLTAAIAGSGVDALMTTGQAEVTRRAVDTAQQRLDAYGLGITLVTVTGASNLLQAVKPPPEIQQAFDDVSSARQDYTRKINEATGYYNETLPNARGEASELRNSAAAYRTTQINEATGRAARFRRLAAEYRRAPQVTRDRLHLELVEKLGPQLKTTIVQGDGGRRPVDLGLLNLPPPPTSGAGATP